MVDLNFVNQYPYWLRLIHVEHAEYQKKIIGKWIHHDHPKELGKIANDLISLILDNLSPEIKWRPTPNEGEFAQLLPPILFYSRLENKDKIYQRLTQYGLKNIYWVSDNETEQRIQLLKKKNPGIILI